MKNKYGIELTDAGKRFNREWIFRNLSQHFKSGNAYAITGSNGSGKSTLMQCICTSMNLNAGNIQFTTTHNNIKAIIAPENTYKYLAICTPYLELVEEMTALEYLQFHHRFKPFMASLSLEDILAIVGLSKSIHQQIRYFSSGMKQRLKLAQAFFSDTPILLLDEPCTNLDQQGYTLYQSLISDYCKEKLVIICSNEETEIACCKERIHITDYK
ncbi:MAG: ATP-binding cassette domain-containing protein [Sphingobacteriia bacterium]|nr:MAG: ATP-binding cassette domain-containing protein [Sphingobacteriia bacterium]TAG30606.1 MAG: ATP-binding cassette domain-containing protein [Sphingobacteriia bacterium]TAH08889.1 MAG: ATP-binding cassette domain-containing protein [Sphingobacteriia bacterium]